MIAWLDLLGQAFAFREPSVLAMVAAVRGSGPREPGATMVVTPSRVLGSVGGGNVEFMAIDEARQVLRGHRSLPSGGAVRRYVLGTDLRQCCGGVTYLHFEALPAEPPGWFHELVRLRESGLPSALLSRVGKPGVDAVIVGCGGADGPGTGDPTLAAAVAAAADALEDWDASFELLWSPPGANSKDPKCQDFVLIRPVIPCEFRLALFGAGHVGRAVIRVLEPLVDQITWSDAREGEFPSQIAPNVRVHTADPFQLIECMAPGAYFLVMTHSHSLDLALCESILQRRDFSYLGLIGSAAKRKRFEKHLLEEGLSPEDLTRMRCPIGIVGIRSKNPAAIAVSVAAEMLTVREQRAGAGAPHRADQDCQQSG